jgi:4-amino-4-deoxy-L-arabinose transferase-like glycosyltransferase
MTPSEAAATSIAETGNSWPRSWWPLFAVAAATFLPALGFYYVGEEAIFPISALEMWFHGEPVKRLLFGADLQHTPLFAWLIIPPASLFGWDAMLVVARGITITATLLTGVVVAWLAQALYGNRIFSAFAAAVYLTLADLFFYRGWLAYVDPLFGLLVFSAIACLWLACERRRYSLLALAVVLLYAAFMAKALTAYVFYAGAGLVLLFRADYRRFLLTLPALALHAAGAALLAGWLMIFASNRAQGSRMFSEILAKLAPENLGSYLGKLVAYPLETLLCLAPAGLIALWLVLRQRSTSPLVADTALKTAAWIALVNYLPYWLAPNSHVRYLLPLYPLAGLVIARLLWLGGPQLLRLTRRWLIGAIVLKLIVVTVVFPLYQARYRGANYAETAQVILDRTRGHALYTSNVSASGLSVAAYMDVARLPQPPLTFPPAQWTDGFVMAYQPDPQLGQVAAQYRLGGNELYLLCRGAACTAQPPGLSN